MLDLKRKVWGEVDKLVGTETILGTSTSCIGGFLFIFVLIFVLHSSEQDLRLHGAQSPVHRGAPVQPSIPHTHGRVGACTMDQHRGFCTFQFLHCFASILCAELHNCTLFASQYSVHPALSYIFVGPRWCSRPYGRGWTGSCQPLKGGAWLCPQQDAGGENLRQRLTFLDMIFFK